MPVTRICICQLLNDSFLVHLFLSHNRFIILRFIIIYITRFIILRRIFVIMSMLYLYRAITMYVTVLPKSNRDYYCSPKHNKTTAFDAITRSLHIMAGFGLSMNGFHTYCGDYIFSGKWEPLFFSCKVNVNLRTRFFSCKPMGWRNGSKYHWNFYRKLWKLTMKLFLWAHMYPYENSEILSVRTPRKEITLASSISVLLIDTSMERSSRVLQHENKKIFTFQKRSKLNFCILCVFYFDITAES